MVLLFWATGHGVDRLGEVALTAVAMANPARSRFDNALSIAMVIHIIASNAAYKTLRGWSSIKLRLDRLLTVSGLLRR